jgi:hypothetical protein
LDLNVLIDVIGFVPEGAAMAVLAPWAFGGRRALLGLDAERSRLSVRGALGRFKGLFQLGNTPCFEFQLLVERNVLGPQGIHFGRHLAQALSLHECDLE